MDDVRFAKTSELEQRLGEVLQELGAGWRPGQGGLAEAEATDIVTELRERASVDAIRALKKYGIGIDEQQ